MARIRSIKPEFFTDEDLGALPATTRLLFIGMWCEADKAGRLKDKPKTLKARCLPFDNVDIEKALTLLADGRFIIRYTVDGEQFIQIRTWDQHQRPHHTERESTFPESVNGSLTVKQPLENGEKKHSRFREPSLPFLSLPVEVSKNLDTEEFHAAWESWVRHRIEIKKPLTAQQVDKQLKQFCAWGSEKSVAVITHTIRQGWQGLREPNWKDGSCVVDQGKLDSDRAFQLRDAKRKAAENGQQ